MLIPDPTVIPYHLIAGGTYQKSTTSQLTAEQLAAIFTAITLQCPPPTSKARLSLNPTRSAADIAHGADITCMASRFRRIQIAIPSASETSSFLN